MSSLPFPIRLAAGLVATGIDTVRTLPAELPSIGVRLAGTAARFALQVRNEITELAIRGEELLDGTPTAQERPAWATFDDDTNDDTDYDTDNAVAAPPAPRRSAARRSAAADLEAALGADTPGWSDPDTAAGATNTAAGATDTAAGAADSDAAAAAIVTGYGALTLGQLRNRLTPLDLGELRALLAAEERAGRRPAFLTLISNRIATLERTGS